MHTVPDTKPNVVANQIKANLGCIHTPLPKPNADQTKGRCGTSLDHTGVMTLVHQCHGHVTFMARKMLGYNTEGSKANQIAKSKSNQSIIVQGA